MDSHDLFKIASDAFAIQQNEEEIVWAIDRIKKYLGRPAKYFLEIGCGNGGSLVEWSSVMAEDGVLIGITTSDKDGYDSVSIIEENIKKAIGKKVYVIDADAHDPITKGYVSQALRDNKLDVLFIDEDKTFEGAATCYHLYKDLVESPGIIAFHDIQPASPESEEQNPTCAKFYQWLKYFHSYEEKRIPVPGCWRGIGILFV